MGDDDASAGGGGAAAAAVFVPAADAAVFGIKVPDGALGLTIAAVGGDGRGPDDAVYEVLPPVPAEEEGGEDGAAADVAPIDAAAAAATAAAVAAAAAAAGATADTVSRLLRENAAWRRDMEAARVLSIKYKADLYLLGLSYDVHPAGLAESGLKHLFRGFSHGPLAAPGNADLLHCSKTATAQLLKLRQLLLGSIQYLESEGRLLDGLTIKSVGARMDLSRSIRLLLSNPSFPPGTFFLDDGTGGTAIDGGDAPLSRRESPRVRLACARAKAEYELTPLAAALRASADAMGMEYVLFIAPFFVCEDSTVVRNGGSGGSADPAYAEAVFSTKWMQNSEELAFLLGVLHKLPVGKKTRMEDKKVRGKSGRFSRPAVLPAGTSPPPLPPPPHLPALTVDL